MLSFLYFFVTDMIKVEVFWVVTPCSVLVRYQRFRILYCLHLLDEIQVAGTLMMETA